LIFALIFAVVWAQQPEPEFAPVTNGTADEPSPIAPPNGLDPAWDNYIRLGTSIAAIVFGLLWVFFGYRLVKIVLFIAGFIMFFFILLNVLVLTSITQLWLHYVIAAGAGLIGGFLFVILRKIGYFLFGLLLGVIVCAIVIGATPLASLFANNLIPLIIILSTGLIFGIVTVLAHRHLLIVGTSFNGAYLVGYSIDKLVPLNTGISSLIVNIITKFSEKNYFSAGWQPYALLAGIVVFAVVGIFVQYRFTAANFNVEEDKKEEEQPLMMMTNI